MMNRVLTLRTKPKSIVGQFKCVFDNGGTINLKLGGDNFIFGVGGEGSILFKLVEGVLWSYQRDKGLWVVLE